MTDYSQEFGEGVDRLYEVMESEGLPQPEYKTQAFKLSATIRNAKTDGNFCRLLPKLLPKLPPKLLSKLSKRYLGVNERSCHKLCKYDLLVYNMDNLKI